MRLSRSTAALLGSFSAVGCAGNVKTKFLEPAGTAPGRELPGVVFYMPQYVKLTYAFTVRVDKDGQVLGRAEDKTCEPLVQREDVALMADLGRPAVIRNTSGFLSAAKFSVALTNGLLASVNAEPTQKLSDLLTAAASVVKEVGVVAAIVPSQQACNASPALVAFQRIDLK